MSDDTTPKQPKPLTLALDAAEKATAACRDVVAALGRLEDAAARRAAADEALAAAMNARTELFRAIYEHACRALNGNLVVKVAMHIVSIAAGAVGMHWAASGAGP